MKIGIIDCDGAKFPNNALMKISAYHKYNGDSVEWVNFFNEYDRVYISKIFTFSPDITTVINSPEIIKGGTGYNIDLKLPKYIEEFSPDYSIYPQHEYSIMFFSRGCIRSCPFCLVNKKEGKIKPETIKQLNKNGKHIEVLDNNFFANPLWREAVKFLNNTKQYVNLHGVDVRIINEEQAVALNSMKLKGSSIHIAWDNPKDNVIPKIELLLKHVKRYKITCYVLIGYWSTPKEDMYRVKELKRLGIDSFVMAYRDYENKKALTQYEIDFARWVNKKQLFKSVDFENYEPRKGFKCSKYFSK